MTSLLPSFGRVEDVAVREAFAHEAFNLTPWLAHNLDRLSDEIGIKLDLEGTEVKVGGFAADILARDVVQDRLVLVENQLETSDHTHLGQIMTYLAGLDASIMIWIAPSFREPHLAAIHWLNRHTDDSFAFFAVRLRVVRIGASEMAPLFEAVEKPNDWERQVQNVVRVRDGLSEIGQRRLAFWTHLVERHPQGGFRKSALTAYDLPLAHDALELLLFVAKDEVGIRMRARRGASAESVENFVSTHRAHLAELLGDAVSPDSPLPALTLSIDTLDEGNLDTAVDWLAEQASRFRAAIAELVENGSSEISTTEAAE